MTGRFVCKNVQLKITVKTKTVVYDLKLKQHGINLSINKTAEDDIIERGGCSGGPKNKFKSIFSNLPPG